MPTVLTVEGFAFRVYPDDHAPAHAHVWKAGGWTVVKLPTSATPARVLRATRMTDRDVARAVRLIEENALALWDAWRRYHDPEADG
jgi:hypothetical protein